MKLVDSEISGFDWSSLRCGCGESAEHVAETLRRLAHTAKGDDAHIDFLDGHVVAPSVVEEPALPAVSVCLAALADDVSESAQVQFLKLLLYVVGDNQQPIELAREGRDLVSECRQAALPGTWLLYSVIFKSDSFAATGYAYDILSILDEDNPDRLSRVRIAAAERLPRDIFEE